MFDQAQGFWNSALFRQMKLTVATTGQELQILSLRVSCRQEVPTVACFHQDVGRTGIVVFR